MRHRILGDFEIQTDHLILARWPNLVLINKKKKNLSSDEFRCFSVAQSENERKFKKIDKYLDLARELKKTEEYEGDRDAYCS